MGKRIDITGKKFGRLVALEPHHSDNNNQWHWLFLCECGNNVVVNNQSVKYGFTKSCGCLNIEKRKLLKTEHNMHQTRFYHIWENMKQRCINPKSSGYKNYGGRGVSLCERWLLFKNFRDDMFSSYEEHVEEYGVKNTQIDRIDCDGNYLLENCRWVTIREQALNKRKK